MRQRTVFRALATVAILIVASAAPASATDPAGATDPYLGAAKVYIDPALYAGGHEVLQTLLDPGQITCKGGEVTGSMPPCSPGTTKVLIRGRKSEAIYVDLFGNAAPYFDGVNTIVSNCNLDGNYQGQCWGTFRWNIGTLGHWDGVWWGPMSLAFNIGYYTAVGNGRGGELGGLSFTYTAVYSGGEAPGSFAVRMREPN